MRYNKGVFSKKSLKIKIKNKNMKIKVQGDQQVYNIKVKVTK